MTTKTCKRPTCGYKQKLKADRKVKTKWRCSNCGKWNKAKLPTILALIVVGMIALTPIAYGATEVSVFLPINKQWEDDRCVLNVYAQRNLTQFICSWDWKYTQEVFNFLPSTDVPTFEEYEKSVIDYLNSIEEKTDEEIVEEFEAKPEPEIPQWQKALEEKKQEIREKFEEQADLLKECDALTDRWKHIQSSDYIGKLEVTDAPFLVEDYANSGKEGDINLMIEACRGMIKFQPQILQYEHLIDSASEIVVTTQTEEEHLAHEQKQDDADQAKLDEAQFWLDWRCQPEQVKIGLCKEHLDETARDPNRGGFTYDEEGNVVGKDCSYYYIDVDRRNKITQKIEFCISDEAERVDKEGGSIEEQLAQAQRVMCDEYMPHYAHQETIPQWLSHCEGYSEPPIEEEAQTKESCPDCDIEEEVGVRSCYEAGRGEVDCEKYDADKAEKERDN